MRQETINIYQFQELSEDAKQNAINWYRKGEDNSFIYDEAHETVKEFHALFGTSEGSRSWLDVNTSHIEDDALQLTGLRLRTFIINNFGHGLFTPKYKGHFAEDKVIKHPRVKTNFYDMNKGAKVKSSNVYYSGVQKDNCCVLTGVCYDEDILQPIYEFLNWNLRPDYNKDLDFETLLQDCFTSLENSIENEVEARNEDEYIIETIEANEYEFNEDGSIY